MSNVFDPPEGSTELFGVHETITLLRARNERAEAGQIVSLNGIQVESLVKFFDMIEPIFRRAEDAWENDPEKFRREKPSCSTLPLQTGEVLIDYASAGVKIDKARFHLDEALPTGQKRRGELALKLMRQGLDELCVWMRARGYDV